VFGNQVRVHGLTNALAAVPVQDFHLGPRSASREATNFGTDIIAVSTIFGVNVRTHRVAELALKYTQDHHPGALGKVQR